MNVYADTGILIDYLAQENFTALRTARRGRRDGLQLYRDAVRLFNAANDLHCTLLVSSFSFYEAEEALYKAVSITSKGTPDAERVRLAACRPIVAQALNAARLFGMTILPMTEAAVADVADSRVLFDRAVRVADALHLVTASHNGADVLVSADRDILKLDAVFPNRSGEPMRCMDSDRAFALLPRPV